MTRSIPNISSSGNMRPQSMTTISSRYSNTYMFLPISPTPPSGMMRSGWSDVLVGIWVLEQGELVGVGGRGLEDGRRHGFGSRFRDGVVVDRRDDVERC